MHVKPEGLIKRQEKNIRVLEFRRLIGRDNA